MGDVMFDPERLNNGADRFDQHAELLGGHLRQLDQVAAALPKAFAGAGMAAWPAVRARLAQLKGHLQAVHSGTTKASPMLRLADNGSSEIDRQSGASMKAPVAEA